MGERPLPTPDDGPEALTIRVSFRTIEVPWLRALEHILQPDLYKQLYGELVHKPGIDDLFGWLGYPM